MATREDMLRAVRNALKKKGQMAEPPMAHSLPPLNDLMPPIPAEKLFGQFETELIALGCKSYRASELTELWGILRTILEGLEARSVVVSRNPLLFQLNLPETLRQWGTSVAEWPGSAATASSQTEIQTFRADCFRADAGITGADFALAETGSFILTSFTEGSQLASLAPPVHIVLYRRSQIRASLDEILPNLPVSTDPSRPSPARSVVFVTGTSRTADIEQVLVRGVHGPREVHAILVEESCLAS